MQRLTRHDDLDELRQRKLAIPSVFQRGTWLALALGQHDGLDLGPTATQILIWLPIRVPVAESGAVQAPTWAEVDAALGARGARTSRTVPIAASALWEGLQSPEVTAASDHWVVNGADYPSGSEMFGNIFWKHGWVLATGVGLLVSLVSD
jgi:hypothetical protein